MSLDVLVDEPVGRSVDGAGTAGELLDERLRDPEDLPGGVTVSAAWAPFPVDAEHAGQVVAERRLVQFGECDDPPMQWGAVDGAPLAVAGGLDLVGDDDVGVQVRLVGP